MVSVHMLNKRKKACYGSGRVYEALPGSIVYLYCNDRTGIEAKLLQYKKKNKLALSLVFMI